MKCFNIDYFLQEASSYDISTRVLYWPFRVYMFFTVANYCAKYAHTRNCDVLSRTQLAYQCVYDVIVVECWKFPVFVHLSNEPNVMVSIFLIYILIF